MNKAWRQRLGSQAEHQQWRQNPVVEERSGTQRGRVEASVTSRLVAAAAWAAKAKLAAGRVNQQRHCPSPVYI